MRKLLFFFPLTLGVALAKTPMSSTTAVFTIPAGAKTVVLEMDGETRVHSLPASLKTLPVNIVMSSSGVRYTYLMSDRTSTRKVNSVVEVNLKFKPFPQKQMTFRPALNAWTSIPTGQALSRWKITFGNGQGLHKENNDLSLSVLFTQKPAKQVKDGLRPPQQP